MFVINPYRFGGAFTYYATDFTGAPYLTRGSDLTGNADSKVGLLSMWIKYDAVASCEIFREAGGYFRCRQTTSRFNIMAYTSGASKILDLSTSVLSTGTYYHILASWNLAAANNSWVYVNGSDDTTRTTHTDDTIDYTRSNYAIGATAGGTGPLNGRLCELYWANEFLDITNAANRLKFRTAGGKPENLGANGSTPTGTQPLVYLRNPYSSFETNLGSGGNFTVNSGPLGDGGADIP